MPIHSCFIQEHLKFRRKPLSELRVEEAKELMKEKGIDMDKVVVHAPYIINLRKYNQA